MGTPYITDDAVLAAVRAGCDDVHQLAEHFRVAHSAATLRGTIYRLAQAGQLNVDPDHGYRITATDGDRD